MVRRKVLLRLNSYENYPPPQIATAIGRKLILTSDILALIAGMEIGIAYGNGSI